MYMVIIFVAAFLLVPDWVPLFVNDKVGIPYTFHIFVFAASFVLAVNMQRIFIFIRRRLRSYLDNREEKQQIAAIHSVIDSLNAKQRKLLSVALSRDYPKLMENRDNPNVKKLVELGVLIPQAGQLLPHENPVSVLYVADIYWSFLHSR